MSRRCEGETHTGKPCPWTATFRVAKKVRTPKGVVTKEVFVCEVHVNAALRAGGRAFNLREPAQ